MKKVLALLLFVCALFALTACGSKGLAGEWSLESVTMEGEDVTEQMLAGGTMTLTFEKDGSGSWEMKAEVDGEEMSEDGEASWEADGDAYKVTIDGEDATATLDGKKLTIDMEGIVYVFTK